MKKLAYTTAIILILAAVSVSCVKKDPYPLHTLLRTGTEKQINAFLANPKRAAKYINLASDTNQSPLLVAIESGCDISIIKLLIASGADPTNGDRVQALYEAVANRTAYDIIKLLIDAGMTLPYSEDWQRFIEEQYAAEPMQGVNLACCSLRYPPDPRNEYYLRSLWVKWDRELKSDPRFIAIVLRRAAATNSFIYTITKLVDDIQKDKDRALSLFDYCDRNTTEETRQKYVAKLISDAEVAILNKPSSKQEVLERLREDTRLITEYYTINLDIALNSPKSGTINTPLTFALLYDQELAKLLILHGANPNFPSNIRYLPKYRQDDAYFISKAEEYIQLLDSFKPAGLLPAITQLQDFLDQGNFAQAEKLLDQYPRLKDPDTYIYFHCTETLYPVLRYANAMDEKRLVFLFEHDFYPGYSYFITDYEAIEYHIERASIVSWIIRHDTTTTLRFILNRKFQQYLQYVEPVITWDDMEYAVQNGNMEMLSIFKELGIPLTRRIYTRNDSPEGSELFIHTLLHSAVQYGHVSIVRFLIEQGADVNALSLYIRVDSSENMRMTFSTALDLATSTDIKNLLMAKGALSLDAILQQPSKYKKLIERWNLPTFTAFYNNELSLHAHSGSKKAPSNLNELQLYVLGTLESGDGYLVLDETLNLWDLVRNESQDSDMDTPTPFSLHRFGIFNDIDWSFRDPGPITITYLK